MTTPPQRERIRIELYGVVQGVGLRPEIFKLVEPREITGRVYNGPIGVVVELQGAPPIVRLLVGLICDLEIPDLRIDNSVVSELPLDDSETAFVIDSTSASGRGIELPPDRPPCRDCLQDLDDPRSRRYMYPLTACTSCGPRLTVSTGLPYSRPRTSMAEFDLCESCAVEYTDPRSRRFNFETNSCWACGPGFTLLDLQSGLSISTSRRSASPPEWADLTTSTSSVPPNGRSFGQMLHEISNLLDRGQILGIKSVGGFQLLADATNEAAIVRLRERKQRPSKPFAVLVRDTSSAEELADLSTFGAKELRSPHGSIVVAPMRAHKIAPAVQMGRARIGVVLPASPLLYLLADRPLVVTSANRSDRPIVFTDKAAADVLPHLADMLLTHERAIVAGVDDSVSVDQVDHVSVVRRSRGYCPESVRVSSAPVTVLAVGADQKNTIALALNGLATFSPHIGSVEGLEAELRWNESLDRLVSESGSIPDIVVCDSHPDFTTSRLAQRVASKYRARLLSVQHHHAHALAVAAEHGYHKPSIAIAIDGAGWGNDGTVWGAEVLLVSGPKFERAHFGQPRVLVSGERSMSEPWRQLATIEDGLDAEFQSTFGLPFRDSRTAGKNTSWRRYEFSRPALKSVLESGLKRISSNSSGRLFDLAACLVLDKGIARYDGDLAQDLQDAAEAELSRMRVTISDVVAGQGQPAWTASYNEARMLGRATILPTEFALVRATSEAELQGPGSGAVMFHVCLLGLLVGAVVHSAMRNQLSVCLLAGGSFQNSILSEGAEAALARHGISTLKAERLPAGDGGIALGQIQFGLLSEARS